jgi:hypothetical protein
MVLSELKRRETTCELRRSHEVLRYNAQTSGKDGSGKQTPSTGVWRAYHTHFLALSRFFSTHPFFHRPYTSRPYLLPPPCLDSRSEIEEIGVVGLGQSSGLNYTSAVMRAASRVD